MVSKEKELEMLDEFSSILGTMKSLRMEEEEPEKNPIWKELEKSLMKIWHELIVTNPANRYFGQEISETLHPEYFLDDD